MRLFISCLLAMGVFLVSYGFLTYRMRKRQTIVQRMEAYSDPNRVVRVNQHQQTLQSGKQSIEARLIAFIKHISQQWSALNRTTNFDLRMEQADWPLLGSEFQVALLLLALMGAVFTGLLLQSLVAGAAGAAFGVVGGLMALSLRIRQRQKAFANQLGDMLMMVSNALRAGFSFLQALELVAKEMDDPIGGELAKVISEARLGTTLEKALEDMSARMQSKDFELVVTAVLIQRQVGGNLAQILDTISDTVGERIKMRREIMALTAQGRASGIVLAFFPIGLAGIMSLLNPSYLAPLWSEDMGRICVAGAVFLEIIGFVVINRIVDVDI